MKNLFFLTCLFTFCISNAQQLTPPEQALVQKLNFDPELMILLKNETANELLQMPDIDSETGEVGSGWFDGIHSKIEIEDNIGVVKKLKAQFKSKGYLIFVLDNNGGYVSIAVMKGSDELDITRYCRTDGINHDLDHNDVMAKLLEWKSKNDFMVLGCGRDWLQFEFLTMPKDVNKFAKEAYAFCPDIVDQILGDMLSLKNSIIETKGLYLWWD